MEAAEFGKSRALILILIAATLLAVYLVVLLGTTFYAQRELNQAAHESLHFELQKRASALSYFYSERTADIGRLANEQALINFFTNRALGMSMEYGLRTSLISMRQLAEAMVETRRMDGISIYRRLLIQDLEGEILVDTGPDAGATPFWPSGPISASPQPELLVNDREGPIVYLRIMVIHRSTPIAVILAQVDHEAVIDRLARHSGEVGQYQIRIARPPPANAAHNSPETSSRHLTGDVIEPIAETPFEIISASGLERPGGILTSAIYLNALVFLAIALLALLGIMGRQIQARERALVASRDELAETNRRLVNSQRQLVQSEKMASLGTLAAGVAHEINNPMGFIQGNLDNLRDYQQVLKGLVEDYRALVESQAEMQPELKRRWEERLRGEDLDFLLEDSDSLVEDSLEGSRRVATIVAGLRTFANSGESRDELVNVNACVQAALTIASNELKLKAEVTTDLADLPRIRGNSAQITQVLVNLMVNAAQAIESWGKIDIQTLIEDDFLCIRIRDSGQGIESQHLDQLFTPFFTTKPVGSGTGLGLSISHGIIEHHGGSILVESEPRHGSLFTVRLPIADSHEAAIEHEPKRTLEKA